MVSKASRFTMMILSPLLLTMLLTGCGCFYQAMEEETAQSPSPPPMSKEETEVYGSSVPEETKHKAMMALDFQPYPITEWDDKKLTKVVALEEKKKLTVFSLCCGKSFLTSIHLSSREYLIRGAREEEGYGLYSYILLSTRPGMKNKKQFERYLALHQAYVTVLDVYTDFGTPMELRVLKENQNITYWPLDVTLYSKIRNDQEWFVTNYDHRNAKLILAKLSKVLTIRNPGPFIVSTRFPLTSKQGSLTQGEGIVIDLSRIDQGKFETVLRIFRDKIAAAPDSWNPTFDFGIIQAKCVSALELHGLQTIEALKFVKKWFVTDAIAGTEP